MDESDEFDPSAYWERRYRKGGNSGAGSYGHLARYKADFLNSFVTSKKVRTVLELGCGDGEQLRLANYRRYTGYDVSRTAVEICRKKFSNKRNYHFKSLRKLRGWKYADVSLSLDVIFHLTDDKIFHEHMNDLFDTASRYVIIYSSNEKIDDPAIHVRHREFTEWVRLNQKNFSLVNVEKNPFPWNREYPKTTTPSHFYVFKRSNTYSFILMKLLHLILDPARRFLSAGARKLHRA